MFAPLAPIANSRYDPALFDELNFAISVPVVLVINAPAELMRSFSAPLVAILR